MLQRSLIPCVLVGALSCTAVATGFQTPSEWNRGDTGSTYYEWQFFVTGTGTNPPTETVLPVGAVATLQDTSGSSVVAGSGSLYNQPGVSQIEILFESEAGETGRWATHVVLQTLTLGREFEYEQITTNGINYTERTELERIFLGEDGPFGGFISRNRFEFRVPGTPYMSILAPAEDLSLSLDDVVLDTLSVETCAGDVNLDFEVTITDLLAMLSVFGESDALADLSMDGIVDITDLLRLLADFGCEAP